jgi:NAD(P)H-flavin reductase
LVLCLRHVKSGTLTPTLKDLPLGSRIHFRGPFGYFTYRPAHRGVIFVATGVGVAPFCAMARSGIRGFTLLHGVRRSTDLYYAELFRNTARRYVPCLSQPPSRPSDGFTGRVTHYLSQRLASGAYDFYLCGHQRMISEATLIIDDRHPDSLVYTEAFET